KYCSVSAQGMLSERSGYAQ
ncbi:hypothetical protein ACN42_g7532, partial [Penicillium freii]